MSGPMEVARVTIVRELVGDNLVDYATAVDASGQTLPLTETLGILRLAEDTFIREAMDEIPDDDEDG